MLSSTTRTHSVFRSYMITGMMAMSLCRYRGEVYHCYQYCEARWISYSYCDGNPATPGLVTYATPADDDFRTFGNRETCRQLSTQDLPETSIHNGFASTVSEGGGYYSRVFSSAPRPAQHLRSNGSASVIGRVRTLARVVSSSADDDIRIRTCSVVHGECLLGKRDGRRAKKTGHQRTDEK